MHRCLLDAHSPTNFLSWKGRGRKEKLISATGKTKDGKPKDKPKSGVKPKDVPALSPRPTEDGKEEPPSSDREQQGPAASDRAKAIKTKT